jgi:signal transduction histidine kinase
MDKIKNNHKNQSNLMKIIVQTILLLLPCTLFAQYADHRNRHVDSLEQVLVTNPPTGKELGFIYRDLMWGYLQTDKEKSMYYARKRIDVAFSLGVLPDATEGYTILGMHHWAFSQYDSAMFYYDKALEIAEQTKNFPKKYNEEQIDAQFSMIYGNIGNLYNIQGKYHEAVEYYTKALKIYEKHSWKESQCVAYSNIGEMYIAIDNYEQAKINIVKMDSLAHITGDSLHIAYAKKSLSKISLHYKDYDNALQNAVIANAYFCSHPEEGDSYNAETMNILAQIYSEGYDDLVRAEEYARQALELLDELGIPREKAVSLMLLSSIHLQRGEWRQAEQTALDALATDDSEPVNTLSLYGILVKTYARLGDAAKVDEYLDKHNALQSLWSTKHYQSAIREMEVKYETEKKEMRIVSLEDEKQLMMWLTVACGSILLLALAALFFLWRWTIQKRRFSEQRIRQLEQEKQLVATQSLLDGETQERTRLARDMHDGLGGMLSVLHLHLNEEQRSKTPGKEDATRLNQAIAMLDDSIEEIRRVAHHLMPDALSRYGLKIALTDFLNTIPSVEFNYFGSDCRIDCKLELVVYRIIYELVNNALKHASATHILVQLVQKSNSLALAVEDNGCGFNLEETAGGVGIHNIRTRVASFGGTIDMRSSPEKGTETNIEFDLKI